MGCQSAETAEVASQSGDVGPLPLEITLVSWNVQKAKDPNSIADVAAIVAIHEPDLMFVQEVSNDDLKTGLPSAAFAPSWALPWPGATATGVQTLSRTAPNEATVVRAPWRELFVATPKVSLLTWHPLRNGETLLAANVHLMNFEVWDPFMLRAQLAALGEAMSGHEGPIILAGDFNTWSARRLAAVEALAARFKVREIDIFPAGRTGSATFGENLERLLGMDSTMPLDRVYVRGFSITSAEVLSIQSSDHRPIMVTLEREQVCSTGAPPALLSNRH